jgi:hypothetical protein
MEEVIWNLFQKMLGLAAINELYYRALSKLG